MNNFLTHSLDDAFDLSAHTVKPGHFRSRLDFLEQKYRLEFKEGWGEFFAMYSKGRTPKGNLDYDEWAFLCEHFMEELTQTWPPGGYCEEFQERPEAISGFSFAGRGFCLIRKSTSVLCSEPSLPAATGRM